MKKRWFIYMVRCRDGTLYTGITTDMQRRLREHNAGRGAKYTRGRRPVRLVMHFEAVNQSSARRCEVVIKKMPRRVKLALVRSERRK